VNGMILPALAPLTVSMIAPVVCRERALALTPAPYTLYYVGTRPKR
jgi:hypothetical protein